MRSLRRRVACGAHHAGYACARARSPRADPARTKEWARRPNTKERFRRHSRPAAAPPKDLRRLPAARSAPRARAAGISTSRRASRRAREEDNYRSLSPPAASLIRRAMKLALREGAFAGETHIVTGAAQGIGNRVAAVLAAHGAKVALVDLDPERLEEARREIAGYAPAPPMVVRANVSEEADVKRVVSGVLEETGQINGLVNVAGITRDARIVKKSYDEFKL